MLSLVSAPGALCIGKILAEMNKEAARFLVVRLAAWTVAMPATPAAGAHAPTMVLAIARVLKATGAEVVNLAHRTMEQLVLLEEALGYVREALAFVHRPHSEPVPPPVMARLVLQ